MVDYIVADYLRIIKRVPRLVKLLILFASIVGIVCHRAATSGMNWNAAGLVTALSFPLDLFAVFIGIIEMIAVFNDDIKAKTMQIAIGMGINRAQVVAAKLLELALILLTDVVMMFLTVMILSLVTDAPIQGAAVQTSYGEFFVVLDD